jgi:hypothetical protein
VVLKGARAGRLIQCECAWAVAARRVRSRVLVRVGDYRGDDGDQGARGRARVGSDQHRAAGWQAIGLAILATVANSRTQTLITGGQHNTSIAGEQAGRSTREELQSSHSFLP